MLANSPLGSTALPAPGDPANAGANAPTNILPSVAQTSPAATQPVNGQSPGILNQGNSGALQQAMKMMQQPAPQMPAQPQIQMAKPVGSAAGFDPSVILRAMRAQQLPSS